MATEKGSPSLPCDLLREVLARCDHDTLVRCAASSRLLCRCMLDDPAILSRRGACTGGFAPSLFLGVFDSPRATGTRFVESPAPTVIPREPIRSFLSDNADLLGCFDEVVGCGGGLLVLRRDRRGIERRITVDLCVCNPMTGHRCFLPSPEVYASSAAILIGDNATAGPFQLLALDQVYEKWGHTVDYHVRSQLFSSPGPFPAISPGGAWGPVCRTLAPDPDGPNHSFRPGCSPLVINRVAYWLNVAYAYPAACNVFALEVDGGCAELIMGPRELQIRTSDVLLASTPDRRLSFVLLEELVISMFVLLSLSDGSRSWERRVVVVREGILAPPRWMRLDWFGERSGTVVIYVGCKPGRLLLNLETKEVMHMSPEPEEEELVWPCHLYEMDLLSLATALLKSPNSCAAASSRLSIKFDQVLATIDDTDRDNDAMRRKIFIGANLLNKGKR